MSIQAYDKHGRAITTDFKKKVQPILGEAFGAWAGRDLNYLRLPGGSVLQFDLDRLNLADYRSMRHHYQINASLFVMAAMQHQLDWHIECSDKKIATQIEDNLRDVWTALSRGISQAYWAGYSPMVIDFENDITSPYINIANFRDLVPDDCRVNWETILGYAPPGGTPPHFRKYNGINQMANTYPVPAENSLWYPLMMENGDYYGKKLLKPAFPSWFFSQLIHLFSNRYFERFGEPVPVGRAPYDEDISLGDGNVVSAKSAMENILMNLRNRSVVVLPSDKDPDSHEYEYQIEYLESQMRGADFERYMSRLDEEMSISLFTPILLFRTADVGSYNLGVSHMQMFQWMLNYLAGDVGQYIEDFPVKRLHDYNFSPRAPKAYFRWKQWGKDNIEILKAIVEFTLRRGDAAPDLVQLGNAVGMDFHQIAALAPGVIPPASGLIPGGAGVNNPGAGAPDKGGPATNPGASSYRQINLAGKVVPLMVERLRAQTEKAMREHKFGEFRPELGYRRRFTDSLQADGWDQGQAERMADQFFSRAKLFLGEAISIGADEYSSADEFMQLVDRALETTVAELPSAV